MQALHTGTVPRTSARWALRTRRTPQPLQERSPRPWLCRTAARHPPSHRRAISPDHRLAPPTRRGNSDAAGVRSSADTLCRQERGGGTKGKWISDPRRRLTGSPQPSPRHGDQPTGDVPTFGEPPGVDTSQRRRDSKGYTVDTHEPLGTRHPGMPTRHHGTAHAIALARVSLAAAAAHTPAGVDVTSVSTISDVSLRSATAPLSTALAPNPAPVADQSRLPHLPPPNTAPPPLLHNPAWSPSATTGAAYMTPASAWQPYPAHPQQ